MSTPLALLAAFVALALVYVLLPVVGDAWRRVRGRRIVRCPETGTEAVVEAEIGRALLWAAVGRDRVGIDGCSRWTVGDTCGRACAGDVPGAFRLHDAIESWYEGKGCALCGLALGGMEATLNPPGVLAPNGRVRGWNDVPLDRVTEMLRVGRPVCWECHVAEAFRRAEPPRESMRRPREGR